MTRSNKSITSSANTGGDIEPGDDEQAFISNIVQKFMASPETVETADPCRATGPKRGSDRCTNHTLVHNVHTRFVGSAATTYRT